MFDNDTFSQRYDDDAALLGLFREWRAGMRDIEGQRPAEETDDEYSVANAAVWDIARQIYDTPAAGPRGRWAFLDGQGTRSRGRGRLDGADARVGRYGARLGYG